MPENSVRRNKTIALISMLIFISSSSTLMAYQPHPMSIGLKVEGTRILPTKSTVRSGYGISAHYQFDFTRNLSLVTDLGYIRIGKNYDVPSIDFERPYLQYTDLLYEIGVKYSLTNSGIMPYCMIAYSSHNIKRKLSPSNRQYEIFKTGFSPAAGIEKYIGKYWLLDADICFHLSDYIDYTSLRIGFRYMIIG